MYLMSQQISNLFVKTENIMMIRRQQSVALVLFLLQKIKNYEFQ